MVRLVPREEKYFGLLNEMAAQVKRGGEVFVRVFQDFQNRARYAEEIKNIEVVCDDLGAKITKKLNSTFITPIDREDIYLLVTELDDVIDMINDLARKLDIYDISTPRAEAVGMADLLARATVEVEAAFALLDRMSCSLVEKSQKVIVKETTALAGSTTESLQEKVAPAGPPPQIKIRSCSMSMNKPAEFVHPSSNLQFLRLIFRESRRNLVLLRRVRIFTAVSIPERYFLS